MNGFGEDNEYYDQQPQRKSFLSDVGDFFMKALKWAGITLAILIGAGILFKFSDNAKNFVNNLTKDKDGKGGWADAIVGLIDTTTEKTSEIASTISDKISQAINPQPTLEESLKKAQEEKAIALKAAAGIGAVATGAIALKKGVDAVRATGTVDKATGQFTAHPKAETEALKKMAEAQKRLEALNKKAEKAIKKAADLEESAKDALANKTTKTGTFGKAFAEKEAETAEKAAKKATEKAYKLIDLIESAKKEVISTAEKAGIKNPETTTATTRTSDAWKKAKDIAMRKTPLPTAGEVVVGTSKVAASAGVELLHVGSRVMGPLGAGLTVYTDAQHTSELYGHKNATGEYDQRDSAILQTIATTAETIGTGSMWFGPVVGSVGFLLGSAVKEIIVVADAASNGGNSNITHSSIYELGKSAINWVSDDGNPKSPPTPPQPIVQNASTSPKK